MLPPPKDGASRPPYKHTAIVHESGFIVGHHVDPSNVRTAIEPMLDQHKAAFGCLLLTLLLDAGFASNSLFERRATAEVDVLCPTGRANDDDNWERQQRR